MAPKKIELSDFPKDQFELRGKLFAFGIEERIKRSIDFIQGEFPQKDKLDLSCEFMDNVYLNTFKGVVRELGKHGGLPGSETYCQFDLAIKHALAGSYKAAFDNLRCCLELTVLSVYFSFEKHVLDSDDFWSLSSRDLGDALQNENAWLHSMSYTPQFTKMLKSIMSQPRFAGLDAAVNFSRNIKQTFHNLSDFTHVNGRKKSTQFINGPSPAYNQSFFQSVDMDSLNLFLNVLIELVGHLVTLISLYNPIILVELPLEEKFGFNEPVGFIPPGQSEIIWQLIPESYKKHFESVIATDSEVLSLIEWVRSLPSLNSDDIRRQLDAF